MRSLALTSHKEMTYLSFTGQWLHTRTHTVTWTWRALSFLSMSFLYSIAVEYKIAMTKKLSWWFSLDNRIPLETHDLIFTDRFIQFSALKQLPWPWPPNQSLLLLLLNQEITVFPLSGGTFCWFLNVWYYIVAVSQFAYLYYALKVVL